jgi:hypothetical protein
MTLLAALAGTITFGRRYAQTLAVVSALIPKFLKDLEGIKSNIRYSVLGLLNCHYNLWPGWQGACRPYNAICSDLMRDRGELARHIVKLDSQNWELPNKC